MIHISTVKVPIYNNKQGSTQLILYACQHIVEFPSEWSPNFAKLLLNKLATSTQYRILTQNFSQNFWEKLKKHVKTKLYVWAAAAEISS